MWQIVGHEDTITLLDNSLKAERLSHAYIIVGPSHVGKMTLAFGLAQALNCEADDRPCGMCRSCQRIAEGRHADVQLAAPDGRTEISIDQIRGIEHSAALKPFEGGNRVYILDGAESLSTEATNCLLKTLEEPPPYVYFILLTTNDRLLLTTIRSRCQRLELRPLPVEVVEHALRERWGASTDQAEMLARLSQGCPGWAVNALRDERILSERESRLRTIQQLADKGRFERFSFASSMASQFSKNRADIFDTLHLWISWWRDLLLIKAGCQDFITNLDQLDTACHHAEDYPLSSVKGFLHSLHQAIEELNQNTNPRLVMEVLMLNMPLKEGNLSAHG